jgi:hypothetical protein
LTMAPFTRTQRKSIRLAASASGSFGLILSIALLAHVDPWSNVWERLWVSNGNGWGTGPERALSAGYWLILIAGCTTDWALKKYCGGNPDEVRFTQRHSERSDFTVVGMGYVPRRVRLVASLFTRPRGRLPTAFI